MVAKLMGVFCIQADRRHCLITATVVLFAVAGFLWVIEIGGYIAAAIVFALTVGLVVRYVLDEPQRLKYKVRQRTMALQDLAYRDGLTGLPNRRFFSWYIEQYLPRQLDNGVGHVLQSQIVLFDLNGFKAINDSYGHEAGDALLKFISDTLITYLPPDTVLARLGGDEFVVLVRDRRQGRKIQSVIKTIRHAASSTLVFNHDRIQVSASVGVSKAVSGKPLMAELLREADQFMYEDKASMKASVRNTTVADDRRTCRAPEGALQ